MTEAIDLFEQHILQRVQVSQEELNTLTGKR